MVRRANSCLTGRSRSNSSEAGGAQRPRRREWKTEAAHQRIGEAHDRVAVGPPPGGIALEQRRRARVGRGAIRRHFFGEQFGERGDVAQRQVESLSRDRMQALRGVAEDHRARRRQPLRARQRERIGLAPPDAGEAAEPQAEGELQLGDEGASSRASARAAASGASVQITAERPSAIGSTAIGPSGVKRS